MKITNKTNFEWVKLHETHHGDVLFFEDVDAWGDEPFIRIGDLSEVRCDECQHKGFYVMSLENFDVWEPDCDEKVRVVNAELILTMKEA